MAEGSAKNDQASALLLSLLSDPSSLSKIEGVLERHGISSSQSNGENSPLDNEIQDNSANIGEKSSKERDTSPTFKKDDIGELSGAIPGILSLLPKNLPCADPRQTALLLAIKPYLSQKRAELIDGFLKLERIGSLLKNLSAGGNNVLQ